jgi:UDP-3-O-[3-hydroxymyristoyl] glucosamine N-acyltransferase
MNLELPTTAEKLAEYLGAPIVGDPQAIVEGLTAFESAQRGTLAYLSDRKMVLHEGLSEGAVFLAKAELVKESSPFTFVVVDDPQLVFASLARKFVPKPCESGISPTAIVDPTALLAEGVSVGHHTVIGAGTVVGRNTSIGPFVYVGDKVRLGEGCEIYARVTLMDRSYLGDRVRVLAGAVIGSDGFGLLRRKGKYVEMPQIGNVEIGDDVRIGALCTIDRATLGSTRIGAGSKIDDHVHVGHNCQLGKNVVLCAQVGLGGSTILEDNVTLGGQVGVGDHVVIGAGASMGAQSGTSVNLAPGGVYFMSPAIPLKEALRVIRQHRNLPELEKRLRLIEQAMEEAKK